MASNYPPRKGPGSIFGRFRVPAWLLAGARRMGASIETLGKPQPAAPGAGQR